MKLELTKGFIRKLRNRAEGYQFEVGILEDGPHKKAKRWKTKGELGSYAGGPVRRTSNKPSGKDLSEISKEIRESSGHNYLVEPFKNTSSDIIQFTNTFFKYAFGRSTEKRLTNLLQAIVRNPILRGEYGSNSELTQKIKGFDRYMIDTGQFFKAIQARIIKRV